MAGFEVHGPFELDYEKRKNGRVLVFDDFWGEESDANHLAESVGVYVFAMRSGQGLTPIYVGQAKKTFRQETFNPSNKTKYHNGFSDYAKGTPVMYFVVHPRQKGKTNIRYINSIEDFLIQAGIVKNPNLQNIKGTNTPKWSIKNVVRSKGKQNKTEKEFTKLFAITRT